MRNPGASGARQDALLGAEAGLPKQRRVSELRGLTTACEVVASCLFDRRVRVLAQRGRYASLMNRQTLGEEHIVPLCLDVAVDAGWRGAPER